MQLADRIAAVLDHLGLERVFIATQLPGDISAFCNNDPDRIAGLALVVPSRITLADFTALAERLLVVTGDSGIPAETAAAIETGLPRSRVHRMSGYATTAWSDIAAERADELCPALIRFFGALPNPASTAVAGPSSGTIAGIRYRIAGSGPPLLLPPFFLAASQWEPVWATLSQHFTVIGLGGPHIGGVALLEDRAGQQGYRDLLSILLNRMRLPAGASLLDIGCGPAALCRQVCVTRPDISVTGVDTNSYLLREGAELARASGLSVTGPDDPGNSGSLVLRAGDATGLPFADQRFDAALCITVLEECAADHALAEIFRVLKPGGAVAVVVRAIDMPQWWNLDLSSTVASKVNAQPQSVSEGAVADRSLYRRVAEAGFSHLQGFPYLIPFDRPDGPIWAYRAAHARSLLTSDEQVEWDRACREAAAGNRLFQANPVHCVVAIRPGAG